MWLRSGGIGAWDFGTPFDEVVDGLVAEFGEADQPIASFEYIPDPAGSGLCADPEQDGVFFADPSLRRACWLGNDLCLYFGGASQDALSLTGWRNDAWTGNDHWVWTEEGVMVGTELSEMPPVTDIGYLCEDTSFARDQFGKAMFNGMRLKLQSEFGGFDQVPPPGDPTIMQIKAGELIIVPERLC